MKSKEAQLQSACVRYFRYRYPKYKRLLFHVPNGGSRNVIEAANLKEQGVVAGAPDLILFVPKWDYPALCIELKAGKNKQTENQILWQQDAESQGYLYKVVRSFDEFKEQIDWYMSGN